MVDKAGGGDGAIGQQIAAYGNGAITIVQSVTQFNNTIAQLSQLTDVSQMAVQGMASAVLTGNLLAAGLSIAMSFASGPSPEQLILDQLANIQNQLVDLHMDMAANFRHVDKSIQSLRYDVLAGIGFVHEAVIRNRYDIIAMREDLARVQTTLRVLRAQSAQEFLRVESMLVEALRQDVTSAINNGLYWSDRFTHEMSLELFEGYEGTFHTHGVENARGETLAGAGEATFAALLEAYRKEKQDDPHNESWAFERTRDVKFDTMVSYLVAQGKAKSLIPSRSAITQDSIPNPGDWLIASHGYALLLEQHPDLAANVASSRVLSLAEAGRDLKNALIAIPSFTFAEGVADKYTDAFDVLKGHITVERKNALNDWAHVVKPGSKHLEDVDLWNDWEPGDLPASAYLWAIDDILTADGDRRFGVRRCDGVGPSFFNPSDHEIYKACSESDTAADCVVDVLDTVMWRRDAPLGEQALSALMDASLLPFVSSHALGLGNLSVCYSSSWGDPGQWDHGDGYGSCSVDHRRDVSFSYGGVEILRERESRSVDCLYYSGDRRGGWDCEYSEVDHGGGYLQPYHQVWADNGPWPDEVSGSPGRWCDVSPTTTARETLMPGDGQRSDAWDSIERAFQVKQAWLYKRLAQMMRSGDGDLGEAAVALDETRLLHMGLVRHGFPLFTQQSDIFHSLVFGDSSLSSGDIANIYESATCTNSDTPCPLRAE